ncbi:hypothetical protein GCM10007160_22020 [Litchfieldella qijiaojingensis]|uniref:histidine kinase n=2 Tax=Litchfieldella qijiaojingensis TaxID=980347 RepID=A0ABQ2YSP4_9GAMM|nr:hypothetical protein GCM10007160_22020 [Halomonas qijiaojingensis]
MERQLHEAQKMAALGRLSGGVAHDFNNLLTVIIGNAELLQASAGMDSALRQQVELMLHAGERGRLLTQRLLSFARREPLNPCRVDINALLGTSRGLLEASLGEQVGVRMRLVPGLWAAHVDPVQLESTIINLAINARDAMPEGGMLTIATSNVVVGDGSACQPSGLEPGHYVRIAVSDTGQGMTDEIRCHAFEPFFTTKSEGKGTGLGLSMVFGFVKRSGGHVTLASEPEGGTTVHLYLPGMEQEIRPTVDHQNRVAEPLAVMEALPRNRITDRAR